MSDQQHLHHHAAAVGAVAKNGHLHHRAIDATEAKPRSFAGSSAYTQLVSKTFMGNESEALALAMDASQGGRASETYKAAAQMALSQKSDACHAQFNTCSHNAKGASMAPCIQAYATCVGY